MSLAAISDESCIVYELGSRVWRVVQARVAGFGRALQHLVDKSHILLVVDVASTSEDLRTPFSWCQQVPHGGYGTVVQVRRSRPDTVERLGGIAIGLGEMCKGPEITLRVILLGFQQKLGIRIYAVTIGLNCPPAGSPAQPGLPLKSWHPKHILA